MIEAAAPNSLLRRGFTKNSCSPEPKFSLRVSRQKTGSNRANGSVITFTDGKKLFVGNAAGDPGAAPGAPKQ